MSESVLERGKRLLKANPEPQPNSDNLEALVKSATDAIADMRKRHEERRQQITTLQSDVQALLKREDELIELEMQGLRLIIAQLGRSY